MDVNERITKESYRILEEESLEINKAFSLEERLAIHAVYTKKMRDIRTDGYSFPSSNDNVFRNIAKETLFGLTFCAFSALLCAAGYVGVFGYGVGGFLNYVFVTTYCMPFEFHTMYMCGMIPFMNAILAVIAFWMLLLKYIFLGGVWIYTVMLNWLPLWLANL